jgi:hypothetical protein
MLHLFNLGLSSHVHLSTRRITAAPSRPYWRAREYTPSVQYQRLSAMLRVGCVTEQILLGLLRAREWKDVV